MHKIAPHSSGVYRAYEENTTVKSRRLFKVGVAAKLLRMESKGFGREENRRVVSLAFLNG